MAEPTYEELKAKIAEMEKPLSRHAVLRTMDSPA